jgi:phage FluMu protein Com
MNNSGSLNDKIKWLENIFKEGKISKESYQNTLKILEEEAISLEKKEMEEGLREMLRKNPSADVKDGRLYLELKCPKCKTSGSNHKGKNEFIYLGKDGKGFLYFKCPKCYTDLKYETLTGKIERRKKLIGFFPHLLKKIFD